MREIIFRGKQADGTWVYGDLRKVEENAYILDYDIGDNGVSQERRLFDIAYQADPSTIGQFTGLTDKNGKRIFEGDTVEWDSKSMDTYIIIYGDDASFFGVPINGRLEQVAGQSLNLLNADMSIVVVGNIHDAPEEE